MDNIHPAPSKHLSLFKLYNPGIGETTSLALAFELKDSTVILDDDKAKRIAKSFHISVTGSLGLILKAKEKNIISSVKDVIARIKATNFHLSPALETVILELAGEVE